MKNFACPPGLPFASLAASFAFVVVACGGSTNGAPIGDADGGSDSGDPAREDGGGTGNGEDSGGATVTQACADVAQARCARWAACSNSTYVDLHYGSQTACIAAVTQTCTLGLAAPATAASAASTEGCAQATANESCADLFGVMPPAACAPLAGPGAALAACFAAAQCASTYCSVPGGTTCGTCADVPQAGDACSADEDCGARGGLICSDLGKCVALGGATAACDKDAPCAPGLSCVGADAKKAIKGACQTAAAAVDATCDANQQTGPGCDATLGLRCYAATSKCVADTLVAAGGTCGELGSGVLGRCEANGTCVVPPSDAGAGDAGDAGPVLITGTCLAAAPNGSPCDTANGPACTLPGKCVVADGGTSGTCQIVSPATCP